jgi:GDPmannose 4,6-dehydratase
VVAIDKRYYRPAEVDILIGDPAKANKQLNWTPKYDLPAIVKEMVAADLVIFKKDKFLRDGGHDVLNYNE